MSEGESEDTSLPKGAWGRGRRERERGRERGREREREREGAGARADEDVGPYTEKAMASVAAPNIRTDTRASRQHGT